MAGVVVGAVAAMVFTQSLRKEGPIASEIRFKDKKSGDGYRVCFRLPREDTVDVEIVASGSRETIKVLADGSRLEGGSNDSDNAHCFEWDGTGDAGAPAGEGIYRLRLTLRDADRSGVSGEKLRIE
ncbi:MAG: hypothetical protein H0V15_04690 [Solirubrobacterales bacterium]|nr:hypothetical protein [Solirubrobacterales bacterium]